MKWDTITWKLFFFSLKFIYLFNSLSLNTDIVVVFIQNWFNTDFFLGLKISTFIYKELTNFLIAVLLFKGTVLKIKPVYMYTHTHIHNYYRTLIFCCRRKEL